jgi:hypothetical protein
VHAYDKGQEFMADVGTASWLVRENPPSRYDRVYRTNSAGLPTPEDDGRGDEDDYQREETDARREAVSPDGDQVRANEN